ncbi:MAG TPA: hypothetical protein VGN64_18225 [Dyadobacter sp.]|nr:hypothetical protein [Dyadobacter sp.]
MKIKNVGKCLALCTILMHSCLISFAQEKIDIGSRQKFGVEFKSYGLGVSGTKQGRGREGFNVFYAWKMLGNRRHQVCLSPQIGYISDPGIQTRVLQTVAVEYGLNSSKRFELGVSVGLSHVLTKLAFDRYEYNDNGDFVNEGRFRGQLSPSFRGRIGWKMIKKDHFSISPYVGLSFIKLDRSYNGSILGFKRSSSVGLTFNF